MAKVRVNLELGQETAELLNRLAGEANTSKTEVVRRSLALLQIYSDQRKNGASHLGFAADPKSLDKEIIGIF